MNHTIRGRIQVDNCFPCTVNFAGSPPATTAIVASISLNCAISSLVIAVRSWSRCSSFSVFPAAIRLVMIDVTSATTRLSRAAMTVILNSLPRPEFNTFVLADNSLRPVVRKRLLLNRQEYPSTPPSRSLCSSAYPNDKLGSTPLSVEPGPPTSGGVNGHEPARPIRPASSSALASSSETAIHPIPPALTKSHGLGRCEIARHLAVDLRQG